MNAWKKLHVGHCKMKVSGYHVAILGGKKEHFQCQLLKRIMFTVRKPHIFYRWFPNVN